MITDPKITIRILWSESDNLVDRRFEFCGDVIPRLKDRLSLFGRHFCVTKIIHEMGEYVIPFANEPLIFTEEIILVVSEDV